ncbi:MAG: CPBP family intramembrane glutamic endopeptidase [Bacteroidota bacterium]
MNYQFLFNQSDYIIITTIALVTVCFCTFWFLFVSPVFRQKIYTKYAGDTGIILHLLTLKYTGFILLGILPVLIFLFLFPSFSLASLGIAYNPATFNESIMWIAGLGIPIVIVMRFACRRKNCFEVYPQIRVQEWDTWLIVRYCTAWTFFMIGYEIMFRGLLLFPLVNTLGVWPAIAINTLFYVGSHLPKGTGETYAALFFGPLLCIITLQTGTVWAAAFIHVILAVSNSMVALKFHPDFKVVKKRLPVNASQCEMGCKCDTF